MFLLNDTGRTLLNITESYDNRILRATKTEKFVCGNAHVSSINISPLVYYVAFRDLVVIASVSE